MKFYSFIETENWEEVYKLINNINADETFWDNASKEQVAEMSYCCWNLLDEFGMYKQIDEDFVWNEIGKTLADAYNCYLKRFKTDNDLTCLMGYMIAVIDYPFYQVGTGNLDLRDTGNQMRKDAYANEPNNPLIKCLNTKIAERAPYSEQAKEYLHRIFKGCDGLIEYFDYILGFKGD